MLGFMCKIGWHKWEDLGEVAAKYWYRCSRCTKARSAERIRGVVWNIDVLAQLPHAVSIELFRRRLMMSRVDAEDGFQIEFYIDQASGIHYSRKIGNWVSETDLQRVAKLEPVISRVKTDRRAAVNAVKNKE